MVYAGAAGETASQFEQALALYAKNPDVHRLMNALNLALTKRMNTWRKKNNLY